MGTIRRWKSAGVFETHISGVVSVATALQSLEELEKLVTGGELYELVLHDEDALIDIDYDNGHDITARARAFLDSLHSGAIAFVATTDASYGRCRQMQTRVDAQSVDVEVFRCDDKAKAWLAEMRAR